MKRIQIEDNEYMQDAIQQEILRSEDSRYDHRLHGVLLVSKGMSSYQTGAFLGHDSTTIQDGSTTSIKMVFLVYMTKKDLEDRHLLMCDNGKN